MKWQWFSLALVLWFSHALGQEKRVPLPEVTPITYAQLQEILHGDSGNVVLVNAWATWCKPCGEEMPSLLKVRKKFEKKSFKLILLSADEPEILDTTVRPALKKFGVDFPSYIMKGKQETFMSAMEPGWNGALALPTTYVYDTKGKLVDTMVGGREYEDFKTVISKLVTK